MYLGIGDACLAAPDIHRGICVMTGNGPQVTRPKRIYDKKIMEYYVHIQQSIMNVM